MMENLSISDAPPQMQGGPGGPGGMPPSGPLGRPPQPQQLPAQMFTTAAQLLDLTDSEFLPIPQDYPYPIPTQSSSSLDVALTSRSRRTEKLIIALRDGRKLLGILRSWDQFGTYTSLSPQFPTKPMLTNPSSVPNSEPSSPVHKREDIRPTRDRAQPATRPIRRH